MLLNLVPYLRDVTTIGLDVDGPVYPFGDCMEQWLLTRPCAEGRDPDVQGKGLLASFNLSKDEFFSEMESASLDGVLYLSGEPYPDASRWLPRLVRAGFGIHLVTARSQTLAYDQTHQWFTDRGLPFDRLTLSTTKHQVGGFDVLYDDDVRNVRTMLEHGRRAVLAARHWNEHVTDLPRATWREFGTALFAARALDRCARPVTMAGA